MKKILEGLSISYKRRDVKIVLLVATIFFALLIVLVQKAMPILSLVRLENFTFAQKSLLVFYYFIDMKSSFTSNTLLLALVSSALSGVNISLAYAYFKIKAASLLKHSVYSGAGVIFILFGLGCAACNTVILGVILGLFGMSSVIYALPLYGLEIGLVGILILSISIIVLARKISGPNVC